LGPPILFVVENVIAFLVAIDHCGLELGAGV
jgi:hypothetical protein